MQIKVSTHFQFGFILGDSCAAQLLSTGDEIYKSVDSNPPADMREAFLNISKTFDKTQIKRYGVEGNLLKLLENYFTGRKQRMYKLLHDKIFWKAYHRDL